MKKTSFLIVLAVPVLVCGCSKKGGSDGGNKPPFEVPVVDVSSIQITQPTPMAVDTTSAVKQVGGKDVIDLYEMSDMHAMIDYNTSSDKGYFGFSGLANFIKDKRDSNPGTILLSSGDMWQGGAESNLTQGKIVAEAMRYVGFESMALGNHEFDWGKDILKRNSDYFKTDMPLLAGNLAYKSDGSMPEFVQGTKIVERGGYKVGIIGTIGDNVEYSIGKSVFFEFKLNSSYDYANEAANKLKNEEHCDVVVWTSHESAEKATVPPNVDAFFGGHEHKDWDLNKGGIPALATRNYGINIAHVQISIDPSTKEVVGRTGELIKGADNLAYLKDETNVKNLFDQYRVETDKAKQYVLNKVKGTFGKSDELADLSTKAMFDAYKDENSIWAFQNGSGGVRTDISGTVTYGDIYTAFPFDNEIVRFEIKGSDLKDFWYNSKYDNPRNLNIYCPAKSYSEYDTSKTYNIITTDYVCTNVLHMEENEFTRFAGTVIRDCVAKYIYENNNLNSEDYKRSLQCFMRPAN